MSDFKSFLINNGVISVTAGITMGIATATFVKSFVADIILPVIFLVLVKGSSTVSKDASGFFSKFLSKKDFLFVNFISELITWVLIVMTALIILKVVYNHYIMQQKRKTEDGQNNQIKVAQEIMQKMNPFNGGVDIPPPNRQPIY